MKTVLLVCTGNTCRSSMAEALLKDVLKNRDASKKQNINVISAGIAANAGVGAAPNAIRVMEEYGIDLTSHRATQLTEDVIKDADLILTMTQDHKNMIKYVDPNSRGKVYTLLEYTNEGDDRKLIDIDDPYGGSVDTYRRSAIQIKDALDRLVKKNML